MFPLCNFQICKLGRTQDITSEYNNTVTRRSALCTDIHRASKSIVSLKARGANTWQYGQEGALSRREARENYQHIPRYEKHFQSEGDREGSNQAGCRLTDCQGKWRAAATQRLALASKLQVQAMTLSHSGVCTRFEQGTFVSTQRIPSDVKLLGSVQIPGFFQGLSWAVCLGLAGPGRDF